jgi:hypothetical protein
LWVSTPNDWKVRINNHKTAHWQRILEWIQKAANLKSNIVIFGVHGYLWFPAVPKFMETIIELPGMRMQALRLCHHKDIYEKDKHSKDERPNGARFRLATTRATNKLMCPCTCNVPIPDHKLIWYGDSEGQATWRRKMQEKYAIIVINELGSCSMISEGNTIQDDVTPSFPITAITSPILKILFARYTRSDYSSPYAS